MAPTGDLIQPRDGLGAMAYLGVVRIAKKVQRHRKCDQERHGADPDVGQPPADFSDQKSGPHLRHGA